MNQPALTNWKNTCIGIKAISTMCHLLNSIIDFLIWYPIYNAFAISSSPRKGPKSTCGREWSHDPWRCEWTHTPDVVNGLMTPDVVNGLMTPDVVNGLMTPDVVNGPRTMTLWVETGLMTLWGWCDLPSEISSMRWLHNAVHAKK